ncbi:hypothetical protein [Leptothoe kymatousa]|uniref:Uncharacterized protein n=1 Tax=Leptothoe kymatousa TAU-MAC 1615 TaxID=2364775 RepID=A0ABS5Y4Q1_9CYAN|nr:hypothetical protein [Leptothoe kymatousa]MBT9312601.1 hypothetical protein [Leptothoe kymatousa TAU-MAC 1615]
MTTWIHVPGKLISGHGVASGQGGDPRFPGGTIRMQRPAFKALGLDLSRYFPGTLNISIHPQQYSIQQAKYTFKQVKWADHAPPEDFSFFDCWLMLESAQRIPGLIYYPHPETKPEHFQDGATLEVITEFIDGLSYGMGMGIELDQSQIRVWLL